MLNTLFEISVYSAVICIAVMLVKKLFGSKMSPLLHYAIWALLIVRLMMPLTIDSGFRLFTIPDSQTQMQTASITAPQTSDGSAVWQMSDGNSGTATVPVPSAVTATWGDTPVYSTPAAVDTTKTAQPWSTAEILFAVWAAGAAAALVYIAVSYAVFRRRIHRGMMPVPDRVAELFDQCRQEMGIRRPVRISGIYGLGTPALFLPAMVLLPVEFIAAADDSKLGLAMRHELTHYRRGDHILCTLMLLLQAVYWFNPFVWVAFRQIRTDIEVACDSAVARPLSGEEKSDYAGLIISMFTSSGWQMALGMARGDSRKVAEQRVRGIFSSGRSRKSAALVSALLAALLLVGCFTTACQPTPAEPIVQSKMGDTVQRAIESSAPESTAEVYHFSAPATCQSELSDEAKGIAIKVDAQVTVPTDTWGIYQLNTMASDKAYIDGVLNVLIGDAKIYGEDTYLSRSELEHQLSGIEQEIENVQQVVPAKEDTEKSPQASGQARKMTADEKETYLTNLQEQKASITAALENAPDKEKTVRVDIDTDIMFKAPESLTPDYGNAALNGGQSVRICKDGSVEIVGLADIGRVEPSRLYMWKSSTGPFQIKYQIGLGGNGGFGGREPIGSQPLAGITISQDEAAATARQAVKDMGLGYLDIAAVQKMGLYNSNTGEQPDCYAFTFTRSLNGASTTYAHGGTMSFQTQEQMETYDEQYARQWKVDEVVIGVDDSGVVYAEINAPQSDVTQLAGGVELKSFDEIMKIFNQQAIIEGCFSPVGISELVVGRSVNVDEIRLGYMPTIWKDHPDEIIFVPVWDFFGSEMTTFDKNAKEKGDLYESLDENYQRTDDLGCQSILTINAMDGTIMQRMSGEG